MTETVPTPAPPVRPARKVNVAGLIFTIVFFALCGACGVAMAAGATHSSSSNDAQVKAMTAFDMCKNSVRNHLKAPSTAKFRDYFGDQAPSISGTGDGPYTVISTVDSQNGFGAMIRSSFVCTAEYVGGDQWSATSTVN
jgi:hypothetical protein